MSQRSPLSLVPLVFTAEQWEGKGSPYLPSPGSWETVLAVEQAPSAAGEMEKSRAGGLSPSQFTLSVERLC